jgi:NADPH-dependent curcumin reductase CurA
MIIGQKNQTINLEELYQLAKLNGARFVGKAKEFGENKSRIVLFDETVQSLDKKTADFMSKTARIECVSISWFFDSLASYTLRDMEPYKLYS